MRCLFLRLVHNRNNSIGFYREIFAEFNFAIGSQQKKFVEFNFAVLVQILKQVLKKSKRERENPDQIITHVETNDLASNKHPEQFAESIIGVASSLKSHTCVLVSGIPVRNDQHRKKGKYSFKGVV